MDDLNILIKAKIATTATEMDAQIKTLSSKITSAVSVKLNIDASNINVVTRKIDEVKKRIQTNMKGSQFINATVENQAFNQISSRIREIRKNVDELAKVNINTNSKGQMTSATLTYYNKELGQTIKETMGWSEAQKKVNGELTKIKTFGTKGFSYSDDMAKAQSVTQKTLDKLQLYENKIAKLKTGFTSPATGIQDFNHLGTLISQYNRIKAVIDQTRTSSTNLSNEQRRGILQSISSLELEISKYRDLQRVMTTANANTLSAKDISLFQDTMKNRLAGLQVGKETVFAKPEIIAQVNRLTESISRFGTVGGLSAKEVNLQFAQLSTSVRSATSEISRINNAADSLGTTFVKDMFKLGIWAAAATAFYAPFRAISDGLQFVYQMDTAITDLSKVVDFTSNQLNEMADAAINLGKQLGKSSVEIMQGMAEFGRVAKNQQDIIELTRVATMASNVTTMTAAEASKAITSSMITFGIEAKDSMKILNSWNEIQNNFRTSAEDLAAAIGKIGAASKVAKVDMADLEGMVTAIVQSTGISGNEAGTAIKSFMSRIYRTDMSDPEELGRTARALKEIANIDVMDANGGLKGFNDLIHEIATAWVDMTEQQKIATSQTLGSTYHYSKFVALMEAYQTKIDAATMARNSENSALEENAKVLDSIGGRLGLLKVASEEFWRSIIDANAVKGMVSALTYLISTFANLSTILTLVGMGFAIFKGTAILNFFKTFSLSTTLLNSSLVQTQASLAGLSTAQITAMTTTQGLTFAFKGLWATMKANPIGLVVGIITAGVLAFDIFNQKQEENARKAEKASQKLKQEQDALNGLSDEYKNIVQSGDLTSESKARLKGIQDELIKTYGVEAKKIDLVNGKYKDQIALIDKLVADKAQEQLTSMGNSGEEALAKSREISTTEVSFGSSRNRAIVESIFNSVIGESSGLDSENKQLYKINGTLKERVAILQELKLELDGVGNKDKFTKKLIQEVTDKYNKLNGELKDNQSVLDKYLENKNVVDFYDQFKDDLSGIKELIAESEKNPDDVGLIAKLKELREEMLATSKEKGRLQDFKTFIDEIFRTSSNDTSKTFLDISKSMEELNESTESYLQDSKDLASTIAKMNDGHKLTTEELYKLIKAHPELTSAIVNENGVLTLNKEAIEKVMDANDKAFKSKLESSRIELENEKNALLTKLSIYGQEIKAIKSVAQAKELVASQSLADPENRALYSERQSILGDLQAIEDQIKTIGVVNQITPKDLITGANPDLNKKVKNDPQFTNPTQALINQISLESSLTSAKNKSLEAELSQIKSSKDYALQISKTNELLSSQQTELSQLSTVKSKLESEFARVSSQSGFSDTSTWLDPVSGEATLAYLSKFNSSSKDTQESMSKTFDSLSKLQNAWKETKTSINDTTASQQTLIQSLKDIRAEIADEAISSYKSALEMEKTLLLKTLDQEISALEKAHNIKMDQYDDEISAIEKVINAKIKSIDLEKSNDDYDKKLSKAQKEEQEIQSKINVLSLDDSIETKAKIEELSKQLSEKQTEIAEMQNDRETELRKQSLEDQLDLAKEIADSKKESAETSYESAKIALEQERKDREYDFDLRINDERNFAKMRLDIINKNVTDIDALIKKSIDSISAYSNESLKTMGITTGAVNLVTDNLNKSSGNLGSMSKINVYGNKTDIELAKTVPNASKFNFITVSGNASQAENGSFVLGGTGAIKDSGQGERISGWTANDTFELFKKRVASLDVGGMTPSWGSSGKLAFLHQNELILSKVDTSALLKAMDISKQLLTNFKLPDYSNITKNVQQQSMEFKFDNLIHVEGNVDKDSLPNLKEIAKYTINELNKTFNRKGILKGV